MMESVGLVFFQCFLCICLADFLAGLFHWWEDTYGQEHWPIVGKLVVKPNIGHHNNPSMADGTFLDRNWQSFLGAVVFGVVFYLLGWHHWTLAFTAFVGAFGNEVHSWNHGNSNPVARFLQDMGIAQTVRNHAQHHKGEHDSHYCPISNWVNPILDRILFWRIVEWVVLQTFKVAPRAQER